MPKCKILLIFLILTLLLKKNIKDLIKKQYDLLRKLIQSLEEGRMSIKPSAEMSEEELNDESKFWCRCFHLPAPWLGLSTLTNKKLKILLFLKQLKNLYFI